MTKFSTGIIFVPFFVFALFSGPLQAQTGSKPSKLVCFIADGPSHGFGEHEYTAGSILLAKRLERNHPEIRTKIYRNGWPEGDHSLREAASIVFFTDGGKDKHPVIGHMDEFERLYEQGTGIVNLHWSVKVPTGKPGQIFLNIMGGYYEAGYSKNPEWTLHQKNVPNHPITKGINSLKIHDEWYYKMRFRKNGKEIHPIIFDSDRKKRVTAWTSHGPNSRRSFSFTGAHYHKNWAHDMFRKVVLNATVWTAHASIPNQGITSRTPTVKELERNQDEDGSYNAEKLRKQIRRWNGAN